jgi:hypothetical protein
MNLTKNGHVGHFCQPSDDIAASSNEDWLLLLDMTPHNISWILSSMGQSSAQAGKLLLLIHVLHGLFTRYPISKSNLWLYSVM